jgi:hypothetical protein
VPRSLVLKTVNTVFKNFTYHRTFATADGLGVVLEFSAEVDGKALKGIDMLRFDQAGKIEEFEVMVRPMSGLQALGAPWAPSWLARSKYWPDKTDRSLAIAEARGPAALSFGKTPATPAAMLRAPGWRLPPTTRIRMHRFRWAGLLLALLCGIAMPRWG